LALPSKLGSGLSHLAVTMRLSLKWCQMAILLTAAAACSAASAAEPGSELEPPQLLTAGGAPLDVEHSGHAAPFVGDIDGDGKKDLLVGEFYQGRLRIYRNTGTNSQPKLAAFSLFQDGKPGGCIHAS
jgi:hypothetical protein